MDVSLKYKLDPSCPQIVYVLGGPGCGKGTQCERLVRDYHFDHISTGDLIREEIKNKTPEGLKIKESAAKGNMAPDNIVIGLLMKAFKARKSQKYLIDGFPRGLEQAKMLEKQLKEIDLILDIHVNEELLAQRLIKRGLTSGREDDKEEVIRHRIQLFHECTEPVLEFYKKFGKVKSINGEQDIESVYKQVRQALKPNIIFFMGPPCVGKTDVAKILAEKIRYQYIDLKQFYIENKCSDEIDQINKLIKFLESCSYRKIIIDSFFTTKAQASIFFESFATPSFLFYFDSPKDEVFSNIGRYCPNNDKAKENVHKDYQKFVQNREQLLAMVEKQPFFVKINAVDNINNIAKSILDKIKPLLIVAFKHHNQDLALEYVDQLEKQRGFKYLDLQELCENEVERNTSLGKKMSSFTCTGQAVPAKFQIELIENIMFSELDKKRFIITGFPEREKEFEALERELFPIDYLIQFQRQNQVAQFYPKLNPYLSYMGAGKLITIDRLALDILDTYITKRAKYGFVVGPSAGGKTTIAKFVAQSFGYELVEWEPTFEVMAQKLSTEENQLTPDDIKNKYETVEDWFAKKLDPSTQTGTVIFDSWFFDQKKLDLFIKRVGLPSFVVFLKVNKDPLIRRYKLKNGLEPEAEMNEEQQGNIEEYLKKANETGDYFSNLAKNNFGVKLFIINADISLDSTQKAINNIFYKRLYLVSDYLPFEKKEEREAHKLLFLNICAKSNITFIDVPNLLKNAFNNKSKSISQDLQNQYQMRWTNLQSDFSSNYTPQLVVSVIKDFLNQQACETRDLLLFGYPSADIQVKRKDFEAYYPRPCDEINYIEKQFGPVRIATVISNKKVNHVIEDPIWDIPKPEQKKVVKAEGEEGGEENKEQPPEEEENKPKFNIHEFTWTKSDGNPKSVPQWFNKLKKKPFRKNYSVGEQGLEYTYDKFLEYLQLINEENEQNKEDLDYRKVNLFVQLRYDEVYPDEETEIDPPEPEPEKLDPPIIPKKQPEPVQQPPQEEGNQ